MREAWIGRLVAALALCSMAAVVVVLAYKLWPARSPEFWRTGFSFGALIELFIYIVGTLVGLVVFIVSLFAGLAFLSTVLAALRSSNWVLRASPVGLYLKFRAYTNHRLPAADEVVLFLPRRRVHWLRAHAEMARHIPRGGERTVVRDTALSKQQYLEIALDDEDLEELSERLERERRLWTPTLLPGVRQKSTGAPISVRSDGTLRIDWKTRATRLSPRLSRFVDALGPRYRWAEEISAIQDEIKDLKPATQHARLVEMVRQGNTIDAVILAKNLYGLTTTEAKAKLDKLAALQSRQ